MMPEPEWSIVSYDERGANPVGRFIERLDVITQQRIASSLEQVRQRGTRAREPLVRHLEGKIWELRVGSIGGAYRILYFAAVGRRFVVLHGFQKKTRTTPRRELEIAQERLARFERAEWRQ